MFPIPLKSVWKREPDLVDGLNLKAEVQETFANERENYQRILEILKDFCEIR